MNIVIAPDSFKGSLSSLEASGIIRDAIHQLGGNNQIVLKPMADGGEGTLESLSASSNGQKIPIQCADPLGRRINTFYRILDNGVAVVESASIAGLIQVPAAERNPDNTTSYGIGEVVMDAIHRGCRAFIIGIGGSATNDGGLGMLMALGMKAFAKTGNEIGYFGRDLFHLDRIDLSNLDPRLKEADFRIACDVNNPLCGKLGASAVYGPQKGATSLQVSLYDEALEKYSNMLENRLQKSYKNQPGAGAAGGLGFAFLSIGAKLVSGAKLIADTIGLEVAIKQADLVITGEGKSDEQTLYGKAPGHVATLANKYGVPVVLISGSLGAGSDRLREHFSGCFSIINGPMLLEECMDQAGELLFEQTKNVVHFWRTVGK